VVDDPVIIDHDDLCRHPSGIVRAYCERMGIAFVPAALTWEPGMRPEWERWADWHESSAASTGFVAPAPAAQPREVSTRVGDVAQRAQPIYEALYQQRLRPVEAP
jgi:hypothetical protein